MTKGKHATGTFKVFQGPALITFCAGVSRPERPAVSRVGVYIQGGTKAQLTVERGFFVPVGATIEFENEVLISYVVPE